MAKKTGEEKIIDLVNQLAKALLDSGHYFIDDSSRKHGSFFVWIHNIGTPEEYIKVENCGKFEVRGKLTVKV